MRSLGIHCAACQDDGGPFIELPDGSWLCEDCWEDRRGSTGPAGGGWRAVRGAAILVALLLASGCGSNDDDRSGDDDDSPTPTPTAEALPTGPVPREPAEPELLRGPVVKVDGEVWSINALSSTSENLRVSVDVEQHLTRWSNIEGPGGAAEDRIHGFGTGTYVVEPGQVLPLIQSTPVTDAMGLSDAEFVLLGGEEIPSRVINEAWAEPWPLEPIVSSSVMPNPGDPGDAYHLAWIATFSTDHAVTGPVLCFGPAGGLNGGSLGDVSGDGTFTVNVVTDAGNSTAAEVSDTDRLRPEPVECRLYPRG